MLIETMTVNGGHGPVDVELREGINGSGNKRWSVQTSRTSENGQPIDFCFDEFTTEAEARNWIEYVL